MSVRYHSAEGLCADEGELGPAAALRKKGAQKQKTFFGLALESQRDFVLLLVEEHLSRHILETIAEACHFDDKPGTGIAFQIDVEDAVGVSHQIRELVSRVEEEI